MAKNKIESELQKVSKIKPKSGEERPAYIIRLVEVVQEKVEKDEEVWDSLSEEAQNFINAVSTAANDKEDTPDFPADKAEAPDEEEADGEDEAEEEEDGEEAEDDDAETETDDEEEKKPVTKKKATPKKEAKKEATPKKAAAKEAAPKDEKKKKPTTKAATEKKPTAEKPAKEKKVAVKTRSGAQQMIKKLILKQPAITVEQLLEKLDKAGHKPSRLAVSSIRSGFRDSIRVIKDAGYLEDVEL